MKNQGILKRPFKAKKDGVFLFAISFFLPEIFKFLPICKLGTDDITRCVYEAQNTISSIIISGKNEAMQWKLCVDI